MFLMTMSAQSSTATRLLPWPDDPVPAVLVQTMEKHGWSQSEIGYTLSWSQPSVSRVLSGEQPLSWLERWHVADVLKVEPERLGVTVGSPR
jgi:transcriptional regulator with XRE-family HTH domain